MGKVRNRLPLHLGVVYAHRRTPLRAVLGAGKRMLRSLTPTSFSQGFGREAGDEHHRCLWDLGARENHAMNLKNGDIVQGPRWSEPVQVNLVEEVGSYIRLSGLRSSPASISISLSIRMK